MDYLNYNSTPRAASNGGCGGGGTGYNDPDSGTNPRIAAGGLAVNVELSFITVSDPLAPFAGGSGIQHKNYPNATRYITGGGGGGIGGLGEDGFNTLYEAGYGGNALTIELTGNAGAYCGGGGGGAWETSTTRALSGGSFVNSALVRVGDLAGTSGFGGPVACAPNTGSGGGGGNNVPNQITGGRGSGGVVIFRYNTMKGEIMPYTPSGLLEYRDGNWVVSETIPYSKITSKHTIPTNFNQLSGTIPYSSITSTPLN